MVFYLFKITTLRDVEESQLQTLHLRYNGIVFKKNKCFLDPNFLS